MTPSRRPGVVGRLWRRARGVKKAGERGGKVERAEDRKAACLRLRVTHVLGGIC